MPFNNPIVGSGGALIRALIRSLNFVTGVSGWAIEQDGDAEFNDVVIRGSFSAGPAASPLITIDTLGIQAFYNSGDLLFFVATATGNVFFFGPGLANYAKFDATAQRLNVSGIQNVHSLTDFHFSDVGTGDPLFLINGGVMSIPGGILVRSTSVAATSGVTTTETKDGGTGDLTFTAVEGRRYRVYYRARAQTNAGGTSIVFRIRDGGGSSPTNTSTIVGASQTTPAGTGGQGEELEVNQTLTCATGGSGIDEISAGTHKVAAFYVRSAGTGTVNPSQTFQREFYVYDEG